MKVLSAKHSVFAKWVLPIPTFLIICGWALWSNSRRTHPASIGQYLVAIGIFGIAFGVLLRRGLWSTADTVEDHGDRLAITMRRKQVYVPISNILSVDRMPQLVGEQITLHLKRPCDLGSRIVFMSPASRSSPTIEGDLESLVNRATQACA
jgi:hypothetical protein